VKDGTRAHTRAMGDGHHLEVGEARRPEDTLGDPALIGPRVDRHGNLGAWGRGRGRGGDSKHGQAV